MIVVECWRCGEKMIEDYTMLFGYEIPAWFCAACHATFPINQEEIER